MKRPLLAATIKDVDKLGFPILASPKLDGIRCLQDQGKALSRSLKEIPNRHIQEVLSHPSLQGLDGELIVGDPTDERCFNTTTSAVMSKAGMPNFNYHVFDLHDSKEPFHVRLAGLQRFTGVGVIRLVPHFLVETAEELLNLEQTFLARGYEGLMVRDPDGAYKYGRSTVKQGILLKLKRFVDSEATITGFVELMHNANEATINELGQTERSTAKAGKVPAGTLGTLLGIDMHDGRVVEAGTGFSAEDRAIIWANRDSLVGQVFKYKHFAYGAKDKPRLPVYLGMRDLRDLS